MAKIQILPPELVNQIAAGEVVDRPASVVKELVENAIDAGATRLDVQIKDGGRYIRVADNGSGMAREDLELAFRNHATSKIKSSDDLFDLYTLGFRGEALASISAVAKVTCLTKTADSETGLKAVVAASGEVMVTPAGCATGTIIEVSDLFYNVPARLKFLKRPQTELSYIQETMQMLALSHPEIAFQLMLEGSSALKTRGQGNVLDAINDVFSLGPNEKLVSVQKADPDTNWRVHGYVGTPNVMRSSKKWLMTFVNGRAIKCVVLGKAIERAYESLMTPGKFPIAVLFIEVPRDEVDVNVHPTKREIKYQQANTMFSFVRTALEETFQSFGPLPVFEKPANFGASFIPRESAPFRAPSNYSNGFSLPQYETAERSPQTTLNTTAMAFYEPVEIAENPLPQMAPYRVIGQLAKTFILVEVEEGLLVVDQHIASERVQFEYFKEQAERHEPVSQSLVVPLSCPVSPLLASLLSNEQETLQSLGFQFDLVDSEVRFSSVPSLYGQKTLFDSLQALLSHLEETGSVHLSTDDVIATAACHSAVRAGDVLNHDQMQRIITAWFACLRPWTCPHGRPVSHMMSHKELMAFFDRPSLPIR